MKAPATPENEISRLKTLKSLNILDTMPEERFDRLTRIARRVFDAPIALVSLVDENRQWFKSCMGLDTRETSRDISFCGHAILADNFFIISDTLADDRFADNPLVTGKPHIRFYAGAPLKALDGSKLGTLCIIDRKPRTLDREQLQLLSDLAIIVEQELVAIQLATSDELTDLFNRRGFYLLAKQSLSICARQGIPANVVTFDLEGFKQINDRFGHAEGDRVLTSFARQIKSHRRDSDIFARLGDDIFVALLTNSTPVDAERFVAELNRRVSGCNTEDDRGYNIAFSYGIAAFNPEHPLSVASLLAESDANLYEQKNLKKRL